MSVFAEIRNRCVCVLIKVIKRWCRGTKNSGVTVWEKKKGLTSLSILIGSQQIV